MNKVILIGRLTKNPDIRVTQSSQPMTIARFTLAVDRRVKKEGEQSADFISCVAFGKTAEFADKYLKQGTKIALEGRWQTGSFEGKDGKKVYTNDCVVENCEFAESKKDSEQKPEQQPDADGWMNVDDSDMDSLPFN